jgi:hypothetical protein
VNQRTIERAAEIYEAGWPIGPRLNPCVCGAGRHAHTGKTRTGGCKATGCRRYRYDPADELAQRAAAAADDTFSDGMRWWDETIRPDYGLADGEWGVGPSDAGECRKRIQYRERPPEGFVPDEEDKTGAALGSMIHRLYYEHIGPKLYPWCTFEEPVTIPGLDRRGRLDRYDPVTATVEDGKTAGSWKWDRVGDSGPPEYDWEQAFMYAYAKIHAGFRVRTVRIRYISRANGADEVFERPYDETYAKEAIGKLLDILTALDLGEDLPRDRSGPSTDPLCRRCFARVDCWNLDRAAELGRSGESLTILGEDPDTAAIAHAASLVVLHREAKTAAEKDEKIAKALLDGVGVGVYGEYEGYYYGGRSSKDFEGFLAAIRAWLAMPADQRPPLESIPIPMKKGEGGVTWRRLRKATRDRLAKEAAAAAQDQTPDTTQQEVGAA